MTNKNNHKYLSIVSCDFVKEKDKLYNIIVSEPKPNCKMVHILRSDIIKCGNKIKDIYEVVPEYAKREGLNVFFGTREDAKLAAHKLVERSKERDNITNLRIKIVEVPKSV